MSRQYPGDAKPMGIDDKSTGDVGQGRHWPGSGETYQPWAKDQIEASSLGMIKDMNRWGLTTFGVPAAIQTWWDISPVGVGKSA